MSDFQINPNFNTDFNNSINNYNKAFSTSLKQANDNINGSLNFDEVFNSVSEKQNSKTKPIKSGTEITIEKPSKETSAVAKFASDLGSGFSEGIKELISIQKQSEANIETFASGGDISIHEIMISAQKSQLAMQMAIQLRNQMLSTYNEFKNMSI